MNFKIKHTIKPNFRLKLSFNPIYPYAYKKRIFTQGLQN